MVASTNHLDKLDAGLSSRPSRFDRKYLFPLPSEAERTLYCQFWRRRLKERKVEIEFPMKICQAAALITDGFSFAYMQEAFVATLLAIAGRRSEILDDEFDEVVSGGEKDGDRDLDDYELWREMKKTIKALREDMGNEDGKSSATDESFANKLEEEKEAQIPVMGSKPALEGNSLMPMEQADSASGKEPETLCVRGQALRVDHQHVPIINEDNTFMYNDDQNNGPG